MDRQNRRSGNPRRFGPVLRWSILFSAILHLLLLWAYLRWHPGSVEEVLRPVRFEPTPGVAAEPFRPTPPASPPVSSALLEQLRSELPAIPETALPSVAPELPVDVTLTPEARDDRSRGPLGSSRETIATDGLDQVRRERDRLEGYQRMVVPDADTTDEESRRRRFAEAIVDSAIAAMGGWDAFLALRDKTIQEWVWDSRRNEWVRGSTRYYRQGRQYRHGSSTASVITGFDGRRSWRVYYGLHTPAPNLRPQAERWDFVSRYRGDGVQLDYGGLQLAGTRRVHLIEVTDARFGREWRASFDADSHLLVEEVEGSRITEIRDYRETGDLRLPYEVWTKVRGRLTMYRWETSVNTGLAAAWFTQPPARTWDRDQMRIALFEHLHADTLAVPPRIRMTRGSEEGSLADTYLKRMLDAAGALADRDPQWDVEWAIENYQVTPAEHVIELRETIRSVHDADLHWLGRSRQTWRRTLDTVSPDHQGETIARHVVSLMSRGFSELGLRPQPPPPPTMRIVGLWQRTAPPDCENCVTMPDPDRMILRGYLTAQLESAGALSDPNPQLRVEWIIDDYRVALPDSPPWLTLTLSTVVSTSEGDSVWSGQIKHRWLPESYPAVNDTIGEVITRELLARLAVGLGNLGIRPRLPPPPPPPMQIVDFWQRTPPIDCKNCIDMPQSGFFVLMGYLTAQLDAAGAMGNPKPAFGVEWIIDDYRRGADGWHDLLLSTILSTADHDSAWVGQIRHRWQPTTSPAVNDTVGEELTRRLLSQIAVGLAELDPTDGPQAP